MKTNTVPLINPFKLHISPMERLLLVNIENDRDSVYLGFEPQVFNDSVHGCGHLVIGWRVDGKVDVYHQKSLCLDPETYNITGKGLGKMVETVFDRAGYEVASNGVYADYEFSDLHGRLISLSIKEAHHKKRKPFGLLAPMGSAAENPQSLPLVLLHDFYFVRKNSTVISVSIDGRQHRPDELPLPLDGSKMYFTRYSPLPLIATFNPALDGDVELISLTEGEEKVLLNDNSTELNLEWIDGSPAIKRIIQNNPIHPLTLEFPTPFPNLLALKSQRTVKGTFELRGHPSTGKIGGHYTITKGDDGTKVVLVPSKGWKPKTTKFSLLFLYTVAKIFKHWPKTYEWTALIQRRENGPFHMRSAWKRIR